MKTKRLLLTLVCAALTSCQNPANTQKAVAIGELGLDLLVAKKILKPEDADVARQTGQILITPSEITLTSPEPSK